MKKQAGFSLIELMIATTLLTLVMFAGYYSYSLYSSAWSKRVEYFWKHAEADVSQVKLVELIQGMHPYFIRKERTNEAFIAFSGTSQTLTFITQGGFFASGYVVAKLDIVTEQQTGHKRLQYREAQIGVQPLLEWRTEELAFSEPLTVVRDLDFAKFSYYGWQDYASAFRKDDDELLITDSSKYKKWFDSYLGDEKRLSPLKVKIQLQSAESQVESNIILPLYSTPELIISSAGGANY